MRRFSAWLLGVGILALACSSTGTSDGSAPLVAFTHPLTGDTVNGTVSIDVEAFDDFGIDKVEIYVNNTLLTTLFTPPYHTTWNTSSLQDSTTYTLKAQAFDLSQNFQSKNIQVVLIKGRQ